MAKITAAEVNKLRQATGAGMMDCKKALVEAEGNMDEAITILRKQGQKIADQRADRDSSEGVAVAVVNENNTKGVAISLNCETDFVAKNQSYVDMANKFAAIALNFSNKEDFMAAAYDDITVQEKLIEQTGVIGEKIEIGGFEILEAPYVGFYVHGNKIAALTGLSKEVDNAAELAKDVSMQVASMGATTLSYKDFDAAYIELETEARIAEIVKENIAKAEEDAKAELKAEGKPEAIWDRILPGKMERFISDNTTLDHEKALLDQNFIKDEKQNVGDYVKSYGDAEIIGFKRVSLG